METMTERFDDLPGTRKIFTLLVDRYTMSEAVASLRKTPEDPTLSARGPATGAQHLRVAVEKDGVVVSLDLAA
ncbi:hypothetical protein ACNJ7K_10790 [Rhodococcus aetherivorans]